MKNHCQIFLAALLLSGVAVESLAQTVWTSRSTSSGAAAVWSGSTMVVSNAYGGIMTSSDGVTWVGQKSVTSSNLVSLAWTGGASGTGPGLFVAVGGTVSAGTVITSSDGVTWTVRAAGTTNYMNGVTWTGSLLVAVGNKGAIITSPDGITWTSRTPGNSNELFSVTWMGPAAGRTSGQLLAVGDGGLALTSPDGVTWTPQDMGGSRRFGILWTGSQLVAVGTNGVVMTSPDAVTWTPQSWGGTKYLRSVVWTGKQLVAVGNEGTIVSSLDGVTWTPHASGIAGHLFAVIWTGTQLVAAGNDGIYTSPQDSISTSTTFRTAGRTHLSLRFAGSEIFAALPNSIDRHGTGAAIYNTFGEKVVEVRSLGLKNEFMIPIGTLANGNYFLEISDSHQQVVQPFTR